MSGWSTSELDAQIVQAAGKRWEGGMGEDLPEMRCGFSTSDASLYSRTLSGLEEQGSIGR
jgi:hypothetical protein